MNSPLVNRSLHIVRFCLCTVTLGLLASMNTLDAGIITFLGSISSDDQYVEFTISVNALTTVNIRTVGYGGDPTADVGVVPPGGFDPYLTLFDSTGTLLSENDDSDSATPDPTTGESFDAQIIQQLVPGNYGLVLTQYGNYALGPNISYGFSETGNSSYTYDAGYAAGNPCPGGLFKDDSGTAGQCRTGNYALEFFSDENATAYYSLIDGPLSTSTPEPEALFLICPALLSLIVFRYRSLLFFRIVPFTKYSVHRNTQGSMPKGIAACPK